MNRGSIGGDKTGLYKEDYNFLIWQNELEVVFSLMTDKELMSLYDQIETMIKEEVYLKVEKFPLSCGGLRGLQATIMFSFWVRKGKGIKLVNGEIVVCELKESPFWERYQSPDLLQDERSGEYYVDNPEHERDITEIETEEKTDEERAEEV